MLSISLKEVLGSYIAHIELQRARSLVTKPQGRPNLQCWLAEALFSSVSTMDSNLDADLALNPGVNPTGLAV